MRKGKFENMRIQNLSRVPAYVVAGLMLLGNAFTEVQAQNFYLSDARSAGMGGTGIGTDVRNGSFYNPALIGMDVQSFDWYFMVPAQFETESDPDNLESGHAQLLQQINALNQDPTEANANTISATINELDGRVFQESKSIALQITIPSATIGGSAYLQKYEYHSTKVIHGNDDLSDAENPNYQSSIEHRGVSILENGASVAKLVYLPYFGLNYFYIGATAKLLLIESHGYRESIDNSRLRLDDEQLQRHSGFNFDVGMLKEFGVWKVALSARNIIKRRYKYGEDTEKFEIGPQVRLGFAYHSRRSIVELDVDANEGTGFGHGSDTMFAALGWEWKATQSFSIRAGYRQNVVDEGLASLHAGIGLSFSSVNIDVATSKDEDETGTYLQVSLKL